MTAVHIVVGVAVIVLSLLAGLIGAYAWWRSRPLAIFWPLLRAGQVAVVLQAALGIILMAAGSQPPSLHLIYGLMPVAIAFVAEQLRLAAAEQVLERHDIEQARELDLLPQSDQHAIVLEIVRRETGVMAASAFVVLLMALRAAGVIGFL